MSPTRKPVRGQDEPAGNPPSGPRTLADDIASIPPGGAPEAVRKEQRHREEQRGGAVGSGGKPEGPRR